MGAYAQRKLEYLPSAGGILKFYSHFILPCFILFTVVNITWSATVSGYTQPIYFLIDVVLCLIAVGAYASFFTLDGWSFVANLLFLLGMIANKIYRTFLALSMVADGAAMSVSSTGGGMPDMAGMAGGGMIDAGMGGMGDAAGQVVANSPNLSLIGNAINKMLVSVFHMEGDLTQFINITECEIYIGFCLLLILIFCFHASFFFTPLETLRLKDK